MILEITSGEQEVLPGPRLFNMAKIKLKIDDREIEAEAGTTVLEAAKAVGIEIPHYCYHPGLSIDGNCRMCLVEIEKIPKPVISCHTRVAEGMVVKTQTENVKKMRNSVMEFLLINHPLDCPTCDQAGECRLQDYYMQYDRIASRFAEEKVHKNKMVDLGAGVMLDQERCIACSRCVRFCNEVSKTGELVLANRGDHVTITTFPGKKLSNPYAGNVVDICPVGALTSNEFRFKKRVWFLSKTESVCTGCSRGCAIEIHFEASKVYRFIPRFNPQVNSYWMCDEGRHGFHFVNENRILKPTKNGVEISASMAISYLAGEIKNLSPASLGIVAHATLSNEVLSILKELGTSLGTQVFFSRNEPHNPLSDHFLMTKDKNPNQMGINHMGFKPLSELTQGQSLIVINGLSKKDGELVTQKKAKVIALFSANESELSKNCSLVFPIPTFAEQNGHFTNGDGLVQAFKAAFKPRGESKEIGVYLHMLLAQLEDKKPRVAFGI